MRMGKTARDIFVATDVLPVADAAPRTPGRPKEHEEPYTKATVVLRNSQIVQLDRLSTEIRSKTGGVVQRAQLIRAVVDAVLGSGLDLTDAYDEEGIRVTVARRLRAAQP
jgi:hypothetical protein